MPGTIQVSVLEFKNTSFSSISLWVSMGKRAFQTRDKGDFYFPLTTFRDNLIVNIRDAEGNEISRTEVETLSIVEKGYWDDIFQLQGGGYVHMKLQFILTDDDRNRIRNVRESALKKKQEKVTTTNVEYSGTTIKVGDTIANKFSDRSEATSYSPVKEASVSAPSTLKTKKEPVSQKKFVDKLDAKEEKIVDPSEDQATPSSVRNMISVFETSLAQKKGRRSLTRTRASKSQPNLVGILKDEDPGRRSALRLEKIGKFPEPQRIIGEREQVLYEQSSTNTAPINEAGSCQLEPLTSARKESNAVDLMRLTNLETATQDCSSVAEKQNRPEIHFETSSSNSGVWLFPDNKKHLCITTAGKNIVHLLEDFHIEVDDHERPSIQESIGKPSLFHRSDSLIKKEREKPQKQRRSESDKSSKNGSSGPFRQVIKIAVIVGFGILVLLTRQKETRNSFSKKSDKISTSPDFMDQLASSDEQWTGR